VATGTGKQLC